MGQINKEVFVCIDCETTGLDAQNDSVIEVAAIRFSADTVFEEFDSLVNPNCSIPDTSIEFHHITQDMVVGKPLINEVIPTLLQIIGKHVIIGHSVHFDIECIAIAADRAGIPHTLRQNHYIDTMRMARLYGDSPTNSLEQLRKHFNIGDEGMHRAKSDVLVNMEVFKSLAKRYKNTEQVLELLSRPIHLKNMPLGKHKGRPMKEVPLEYLRWAAHKDFDQDLLYSVRLELKRRKQGNLFSQSASPFADL